MAGNAETAEKARGARDLGRGYGDSLMSEFVEKARAGVVASEGVRVPTQGNNRSAAPLAKVRYTHEAMADAILANPAISQGELATIFGYTQPWVCRVLASDAFQAYLAERKNEIVDPFLRASVEECFKGLVMQSIQKLQERLQVNPSDELLLGVMNGASRALGYGVRSGPTVQIEQNFVALVPPKAESTAQWVEQVRETKALPAAEGDSK